jgi:NADPH:quinone reductase-like Zn-dependent oxidoreductase
VARAEPHLPHVLGSDMAGMVDVVGPGVIEPKVGDAVV